MYQLQLPLQHHQVPGNPFEKRKRRFLCLYRSSADPEQEIPVSETGIRRVDEDLGTGTAGPVDGGSFVRSKVL